MNTRKLYGEPAPKYHPVQPLYRVLSVVTALGYIGFGALIAFGVSLPGKP